MSNVTHHHRSTLKQKNKPFKSRFASKRSRNLKGKGKSTSLIRSNGQHFPQCKVDRQNRLLASRKRHLLKTNSEGRLYKGSNGVPKVISIVGLTPDSDTTLIMRRLCETMSTEGIDNTITPLIWDAKQYQKYRVIPVNRDLKSVADACLFSDIVLLVLSAVEEVDNTGELCLSLVKAMGTSIRAGVVQGMDLIKEKQRTGVINSLRYYLKEHFGETQEIFDCSNPLKFSNISRWLGAKLPQHSLVRDLRSYIVADSYRVIRNESDDLKCALVMNGYVRGAPMSPDNAVYIPDLGTFQVEKIEEHKRLDGASSTIVHTPSQDQVELMYYYEPNPMDADQPWSTDKDVKNAQIRAKRVVKGAVGMSSYQAAWIVDSDDNEDGDETQDGKFEGADSDAMDLDEVCSDGDVIDGSNDAHSGGTVNNSASDSDDHNMSEGEDAEDGGDDWSNYLEVVAQREKEELEEKQFPDEVEFHPKTLVRDRLARYRGMKNFKSHVWDKYENLPVDYAKISHLKDHKKSYAAAIKRSLKAPIPVGALVSVFIKNVLLKTVENFTIERPPVYISLYRNEEKFTLANVSLYRKREYEAVIKSKDEVVIQYGFRRIIARPIYSTNTKNSMNNVHKFEKFLHHGISTMACMYAPITFGSVPVVVYKVNPIDIQLNSGSNTFIVATGILETMDTSRIVVKRVILTGHPFKVHKKSAVVRYMFFNPEDVNYFKPLELRTKLGLRGHIISSIGTHGRMKCSFDKPIKSHDTVCVYLYKRVFPKWTTRDYTITDIVKQHPSS